MISLPWAMSLFGVKQVANALMPQSPNQLLDKAVAAFDAVTYATEDQFGDLLKLIYEGGDQLQRGLVELMFSFLTFEAFSQNNMMRLTSNTMKQLAETFRIFIPGQDCLTAWQEFTNKLEVFLLVKDVRSVLKIPFGTDIPLTELIDRAYALDPYPAKWAVEGVGHFYADTFWERNEVPQKVLSSENVRHLPAKSLLMLHAGIGLSLAQHLLQTVYPQSPVSEIHSVLHQFVMLCQNNSREGYIGAAYESLGLVTRTFHPRMLHIFDQQLSEIEPDVVGYYWHGVGRALYFFPTYFVPGSCSPWRAAEREAPHELARLNLLAGLAWAITLVNLPQPRIIETFLKNHRDEVSESDAFSNGVASTIMMRHDTTPDAPFTPPFLSYQPDPYDQDLVRLWKTQVEVPCREALQYYYPVLKEHNCLDKIFRYQPLPEVIAQLRGEP
jgi:hypothetical protein